MASDIYNAGQSNVNNAASQGQNAINSFDPSTWASQTQSGYNSLWGNQSAGNQKLVDAFTNQIKSQPSATDYYNQGMQNFNVPALQNTANTLTNAVLQAPISNVNAAKGFNYDNNQVQQKTAQDLQYLTPQANAAQNNASTAQSNAMNFANNGIQQNQMNLVPLQTASTLQQQLYAQQATGFGQQQQDQLQALTAKMQAGEQLSASEMSAYTSLSNMEASYQAQLNTNKTTLANTIQGQKYLNVAPGNNIVNTVAQGVLNPGTGQTYKY